LQIALFNRCDEILDETGEKIDMRDVVKEYFAARRKAFKPTTIQQAWRKSGLRPLNPDLFTPSDFAPSHSSSTVSHTPLSFPQRMPHVPDASSDDGMFDPSLITVDNLTGADNSSGLDTEYHGSESESEESSSSESEISVNLNEDAEEMLHARSIQVSISDQELDDLDDLDVSEEENTTPCPPSRRPSYPRPQQALRPLTISTPTLKSISSSATSPLYTRSRTAQIRVETPITSTASSEIDKDEEIRTLRRQLENSNAQRDAAEVHAVMAQREAAVWKFRLNQKKEKAAEPSRRRLHTSSRVVTNDQGLAEAREDRERQQEKKRKESEKNSQKAAKEKENIVRRATQGSTRVFSGPLSTKNKTDLEDISDALGLSITGTKPILIERITEHFKKFPRLKEDPRFLSLFERAPRGRKRAAPVHDATGLEPPTQRQRLGSPPIYNFAQISQFQVPVASSSSHTQLPFQLPFQPVPSSYFNTFSFESSHYES
jgi:phage gp16-like protein